MVRHLFNHKTSLSKIGWEILATYRNRSFLPPPFDKFAPPPLTSLGWQKLQADVLRGRGVPPSAFFGDFMMIDKAYESENNPAII